MHAQPANTPPPSSQSISPPTAVVVTSPFPSQRSSSTLPAGGHAYLCPPSGHPKSLLAVILTVTQPVVILYPSCWWSYSPLPGQRSSSIPAGAGSQPHTSPTSGHPLLPPAGDQIHRGMPSGHPLTLLQAVIFIPARPALIIYPSCWRS